MVTDSRPPVRRVYIPALDGVRFLAFFLVFVSHYGPVAYRTLWPRLGHVLTLVAGFGWIGVDVFLCLSGFLIATLLLHEIAATGTISVGRFYARRVLRIWPLYYLMLIIGFVAAPLAFGQTGTPEYANLVARHLFPFATLFGNFSYAYFNHDLVAMNPSAQFFAPLWTVALEEQFYLLFPLLVAAVPRISTRAALCGLAGIVAFSAATRLYILGNAIPYPMVWTNTLARLDPIAIGIGGAVVWHRYEPEIRRLRLYGAELVVAVGVFWLIMSCPQVGRSLHTVWQLCATGVGALLLIGGALRYRAVGAVFGWRPVGWLGKISYGLYVFHILAIWIYTQKMAGYFGVVSRTVGPLGDLALALAVTVAMAALSYYLYERRLLRLKERFTLVASRPA